MNRQWPIMVGFFMLLAGVAFLFLAFKVSGLTHVFNTSTYSVSAHFNNIGGLKVRAPVTLAGVVIGSVSAITLDPETLSAKVTMRLEASQNRIPATDTSARILTQGLLGANYISIVPGFPDGDASNAYLRNGSVIDKTQPALILENLIGQFLFNMKK